MKSKYLAAICIVVAAFSVYVVWDFNGGSFDFSDRQLVLVVTDSMDGDVHDYDIGSFPADTLVMIEHLDDQEKIFLRLGDVISYHDHGTLVHHRVFQVEHDYVYVHGDNNHSTEKVLMEDINGKVVGTNWILGHSLAMISANFLVFLAAMFVIGSVVIVYAVFSDKRGEVVAE